MLLSAFLLPVNICRSHFQRTFKGDFVNKLLSRPAIVGFLFLCALSYASAQTSWKVEKTFQVGGEGGWDYVTVDSAHHRLFVTRSTHTMAIDIKTGQVLGDIPGQIRAHG